MNTMVEIILRAEAAMERRLCGMAIIHPKIIVSLSIRPEVDLAAIEFYKEFGKRIPEILAAADDDAAILIALKCCKRRDFFHFWAAVSTINAFEESQNFERELNAIRTARKAIRWVEESRILEEVTNGYQIE